MATGDIAAAFVEDLKTLPDAEVVAVGSRQHDTAAAFARRFDIPRAHGSWQQLAADESVDVVYVANTINAHYAAASLMLQAGKAVLCEKAFTLDHAQAQSLVEQAREHEVFLMEAMWMRCNPAIRDMAELVAAGEIGEVRTVAADFCLPGPFPPDHRLRDPHLGGGALLDLGVYPVSLAQLILGRSDRIAATGNLTPEGVDATAGMVFGYDDGAVATLSCSITADSPVIAAVSGTAGRVELDAPFFRPAGYRVHRGEGGAHVETVEAPYRGRGLTHEAEEVMRCLRAGSVESPLAPLSSTLEVMATLDEVRRQLGVTYPGET